MNKLRYEPGYQNGKMVEISLVANKQKMIKANELRIRNWVNVAGINVEIFSITSDGNGNHGYNSFQGEMPDFEGCEPIPLTPEILEKCGFVGADGGFCRHPVLKCRWVSEDITGEEPKTILYGTPIKQ